MTVIDLDIEWIFIKNCLLDSTAKVYSNKI